MTIQDWGAIGEVLGALRGGYAVQFVSCLEVVEDAGLGPCAREKT